MNANKRQSMKSQQNQEKLPQPKMVAFSANFTGGLPNTNIIMSPASFAQQLSNLDFDLISSATSNINKGGQARVFNYESTLQDKGNSVSNTGTQQFDPEPQFSLHSPFRHGESKKDLQGRHKGLKNGPESAVRGRRIQQDQVDVVCSIPSSDSQRMKILKGNNNITSDVSADQQPRPYILNINAMSHQVLPLNTISQSQTFLPRRDGSQDTQLRNIQNRKESNDSRSSRQNSKSRGTNLKKKRGSSPQSNSQPKTQDPHTKQSQVPSTINSGTSTQQRTMKRPNSAKNLKQGVNSISSNAAHLQHHHHNLLTSSSNSNFKTLITSPTLTVLQREPSQQQFLPPKPKQPLRNNLIGKDTQFLYASIGSLPQQQTINSQYSSSHTHSTNKRGPSGSSERHNFHNFGQQQNNKKLNDEGTSNNFQEHQTFSPLRKKHDIVQAQTLPTSGTKQRTQNKSRAKKKKSTNTSQNRSKSRKPVNYEQLQALSPNVERIKVKQMVIKEDNQEDSLQRIAVKEIKSNNQISFEESAIREPKNIVDQPESHESSIVFKNQDKQKARQLKLNENYAEMYKQVKQQFQKISVDKEGLKKQMSKKKILGEKKENIQQQQVPTQSLKEPLLSSTEFQMKKGSLNMEILKQQMLKKLEGTNKGITIKKKNPQASTKNLLQVNPSAQEELILKQKKQEQREQWQKERQERHEVMEIVKDALKDVVHSTSQTRKKEQNNKSQQRPFSAKMPQSLNQEQIHVKVPPVTHEIQQNNYFDTTGLIQSIRSEITPIKDQKFNNKEETQQNMTDEEKVQELINEIKKQKRDKSKRKKAETEKDKDLEKIQKKEQTLIHLKEQQKKQFEIFKQNLIAKQKLKTKKFKTAVQGANQQQEYYQLTKKGATLRQKSKKKIDDEKENRRVSLSPQQQQVMSESKVKSGRKKSKRRQHHHHLVKDKKDNEGIDGLMPTFSEAKLKLLTQNVKDILSSQEFTSAPQTTTNSTQGSKYFKSQTVADLHQIKNTFSQQDSELIQKMSQVQKRLQVDPKEEIKEEISFKQPKPMGSEAYLHGIRPAQERLKQNFISEQQEMTPIIQQRKREPKLIATSSSQVVIQSKPSDSMKSVHFTQGFNTGQTPFKDGEIQPIDIIKSANIESGTLKNLKIHTPIDEVRSRSNSQEKSHKKKSKKGKQLKVKQKQNQVQVLDEQTKPIQGQEQEQIVQIDKKSEVSTSQQSLQIIRKGSAGFKRSQQPLTGSALPPTQPNQQLQQIQQQTPSTSNKKDENVQLRPKSANVQKINLMEVVFSQQQPSQGVRSSKDSQQMQKEKLKIQSIINAALMIQRVYRGFKARKMYQQIKQQSQVRKSQQLNNQLKKSKTQTNSEQEDYNIQTLQDFNPQQQIQDNVKKSYDSASLKFSFEKNLPILNQVSKNSSINSDTNKLSKSQASLKMILQQEGERLKKKSRPNSSDVSKKIKEQQTQNQQKLLPPTQNNNVFEYDKDSQKSSQKIDNKILNLQKKVQDRIDYQNILHKKQEEEAKRIKQQVALETLSSHTSVKMGDDIRSINKVAQSISPFTSGRQGNNFDSLSSLNMLSKDLELDKKNQASQKIEQEEISKDPLFNVDQESKRESSFLEVLYQHDDEGKSKKSKGMQMQQLLNRMNLPGVKKRLDDGWSSAKKQEDTENKSQFFKKLSNAGNHNFDVHSQILGSSSFITPSSHDGEQNNVNWQFDRKSFQDFFDQNSQVGKKEESKKSSQPLAASQDQKITKVNIQRKCNQYEGMLNALQEKNENDKQELKKLQSRKNLSPSSQKKKIQLEKWVNKQEEAIEKKRQWYLENVNDIISKMDKDLQITKKKIGSNKKGNMKFNTSVEWSHDISIGHLTNSSIHSTPRLTKPPGQNVLSSLQQQEAKTERANGKRLPFEYKTGQTQSIQPSLDVELGKRNEKIEEFKSMSELKIPSTFKTQLKNQDQELLNALNVEEEKKAQIEKNNKQSVISTDNEKEFTKTGSTQYELRQEKNVFHQNLASSLISPGRQGEEENKSVIVEDEQVPYKIMVGGDQDDSLSRQEPPQFQSPQLSAISPRQPFINTDEKGGKTDTQPFLLNENEQKIEFIVDNSPQETQEYRSEINVFSSSEIEPPPFQPTSSMKGDNKNDSQLSDAFQALKEPVQPQLLSIDAQHQKELKELREQQTDFLTEHIMQNLLEQLKGNLYPKRVIIPQRSPSKHPQSMEDAFPHEIHPEQLFVNHDIISEHFPQSEVKSEEAVSSKQQSVRDDQSIAEAAKKGKIIGIKTSMKIVDSYIYEVFKKVKENEEEFIENLSTPLNKDPHEILHHLQNVYAEMEPDNPVVLQQSVLPVDYYLDIERNKQTVQYENADEMKPDEEPENKSMIAEWENIHNKVIFDGINEALDNFRPYGLRGPPMPWSLQNRTLTYKNGQQVDAVLQQVRQKVMEWARTFSGALPCSELLKDYGIKGPLDEDKLNLLREERLALVLASEIEENEQLWTDYEYEETQTKLDIADMILEFLAEETVQHLNKLQEVRNSQKEDTTANTTQINEKEV